MARRASNYDLEAQQPIKKVMTVVDKPQDSMNLIIFATLFIGVCLAILYGLHYISGGGAGITELCNSYLNPTGESKVSKLDEVLYTSVMEGYTSMHHVKTKVKPLLKDLITHFMNNVNGLGSFSDVEIQFDAQWGEAYYSKSNKRLKERIRTCESGFIASNSSDFLEQLTNAAVDMPKDDMVAMKNLRLHNLKTLIANLGALSGVGMNPMAQLQNMGGPDKQPDVYAEEAQGAMMTASGYEKYIEIKKLLDPDFYQYYDGVGDGGEKFSQELNKMWSICFTGEGNGMEVNKSPMYPMTKKQKDLEGNVQNVQVRVGPSEMMANYLQPLADALEKKIGEVTDTDMSLLPFIVKKSITMKISRGLLGSSTQYLYKDGEPVAYGKSEVVSAQSEAEAVEQTQE